MTVDVANAADFPALDLADVAINLQIALRLACRPRLQTLLLMKLLPGLSLFNDSVVQTG